MILACTKTPPTPNTNHTSPTTATTNRNHLLSLLNQCTTISHLKQIHTQILRTTTTPSNLHTNLLLHYSKTDINHAFRLFETIQSPTTFNWNTLIRACADSRDYKHFTIRVYHDMLRVGQVTPDNHTFPFVLKACAFLFDEFGGKCIHGHVLKLGFSSDTYVSNSLIHFYSSCGQLDCARKVFDEMSKRSIVSWNVMIEGLVGGGEFDEGLRLFRTMVGEFGFDLDGYTLTSVVLGCAGLGALSSGLWVHGYILRVWNGEIGNHVLLNNALVEMYCKCGMLEFAKQVFNGMNKRDVNSWNSMILGLANYGESKLALDYFDLMTRVERLIPNSITFLGILNACNHGGNIELGREYFNKMMNDYWIVPRLEHYGCFIDLLARAGFVYEALDVVSKMPMKPDSIIWRSILDACCKQNVGLELSQEVANKILESNEIDSSGDYVLLSRVFGLANQWDDVGLIRKGMSDKGIRKEPGCSCIEINGVNHEFFAGDTCHPERKDVYRILEFIDERINSAGYKLEDEDGNKKKDGVRLHSERLAIAYGLIHLEDGVPLRVFKNLRVCNDCHRFTKLVSRLFRVEIVVRDRARFHHFRDGSCSCCDYW